MKGLLKYFVASLLAILARAILAKYQPIVVMVTGSVGKTSTKDAAAAALSEHFMLRASEKSYNSEFGVPLTIIGAKNPWNNSIAWIKVIQQALGLIFLPNHYPRLLVLEVGADSPGDLARILSFATPDAVIVTKLPDVPVHVEAYASKKAVREEEFSPALSLAPGQPLIISADDVHAVELAKDTRAAVSTFGLTEGAAVRISHVEPWLESSVLVGMRAEVAFGDGERRALTVRGAYGRSQLYAPAAALTAALALGLTAEEAFTGLETYEPPAGRGKLLRGLNNSVIIDDSYNASPAAVRESLESLAFLPERKKIVVIGDMLELGRYSKEEHERIGRLAAKHAACIVTVGSRSKVAVAAARAAGMHEEAALSFDTADEAKEKVRALVEGGEVILVKGSQSIRLERVVEALLADANDTDKLVRQDKEWKRR